MRWLTAKLGDSSILQTQYPKGATAYILIGEGRVAR